MECPACKGDLIILEFNQIEIDHCPNCSGIWLDAGELELLTGSTLHSELIKQFRVSEGAKEKNRNCPICRKNMKKYYFESSEKLIIDICENEHGIWFDNNELMQVISTVESDGSALVISFLNDIFNYKK